MPLVAPPVVELRSQRPGGSYILSVKRTISDLGYGKRARIYEFILITGCLNR